MLTLKKVLLQAQFRANSAGGVLSLEARKSLAMLRRQHSAVFFCIFGIVLAVVVLGPLLVAWHRGDMGAISATSGAMGITVAGGVVLMRRSWREWSQATLLMILLEDADEGQVNSLVNKLVERF